MAGRLLWVTHRCTSLFFSKTEGHNEMSQVHTLTHSHKTCTDWKWHPTKAKTDSNISAAFLLGTSSPLPPSFGRWWMNHYSAALPLRLFSSFFPPLPLSFSSSPLCFMPTLEERKEVAWMSVCEPSFSPSCLPQPPRLFFSFSFLFSWVSQRGEPGAP